MSDTQKPSIHDAKSAFENDIITSDAAFAATPRTDAAEQFCYGHVDRKWVTATFARQLETDLANALLQRNHEQRCVEQKQRLLESERKEVAWEQERGDRFRKERDEARELLSLLGVDIPAMAKTVRDRIQKTKERLNAKEAALE